MNTLVAAIELLTIVDHIHSKSLYLFKSKPIYISINIENIPFKMKYGDGGNDVFFLKLLNRNKSFTMF